MPPGAPRWPNPFRRDQVGSSPQVRSSGRRSRTLDHANQLLLKCDNPEMVGLEFLLRHVGLKVALVLLRQQADLKLPNRGFASRLSRELNSGAVHSHRAVRTSARMPALQVNTSSARGGSRRAIPAAGQRRGSAAATGRPRLHVTLLTQALLAPGAHTHAAGRLRARVLPGAPAAVARGQQDLPKASARLRRRHHV